MTSESSFRTSYKCNRAVRPGFCDQIATWNVEGLLTASKLEQLKLVMLRRRLGIMCLQETHVSGSPYYVSDGFLVVLSGGTDGQREYAGVGFLVSPSVRSAVIGFTQHSNRMVSLKLRVRAGRLRS